MQQSLGLHRTHSTVQQSKLMTHYYYYYYYLLRRSSKTAQEQKGIHTIHQKESNTQK